jgi:hypothetical protein
LLTSGFTVLPRTDTHLGKNYEKWLAEWGKWFVKNDRDETNKDLSKGYVMLRGQPRSYGEQINGKSDSYSEPLVIPLQIKSDTLVFFPVICTISSKDWEPDSDLNDDEKLRNDASKHNQPSLCDYLSVKVNGDELISDNTWSDYNVTTDFFDLEVDPGDWNDYEGPLPKNIDTINLKPGKTRAIINGVCFLGKFSKNTIPYILRIKGKGSRDHEVNSIYTIHVD